MVVLFQNSVGHRFNEAEFWTGELAGYSGTVEVPSCDQMEPGQVIIYRQ